jgi:hypothetical protein
VDGWVILRLIANHLGRETLNEDSLFGLPLFDWPCLYGLGSVVVLVTGFVVAFQA